MIPVARTHHGATSAAGPLLFLESAVRPRLGEWVRITSDGASERRGQVLDASERIVVIQLLEDTIGLAPRRIDVVLTGEVPTTVVGRELLGRAFNGLGSPLDGLPAPVGEALRPIAGAPMNPVRRARPSDYIETGISAIDGMNTLVRGQKLPVFSAAGLPGLELAAQIVEGARAPRDEPFAVIFAAIGITARERQRFLERFGGSEVMDRTILYLNEAAHPTIERLLTPRVALTAAEHLAFELGMHVLVVLADLTHYAEALREIATARDEIPGRRGFPGYMYTDLAGLFERAGIVSGRSGSITQIPIVTMPDDDITHPIPDLTGYITEGQIVLSRELFRRGISPPIDVLPSLSRLMGAGIGGGKTRPEHREWSDQLYALYARGRDARVMAAILGAAGLPDEDRRALELAERFERELVGQGTTRRSTEETFEIGWRLLESVPRDELLRISDATLATRTGQPT